MNINNTTQIRKNSFSFVTLGVAGVSLFVGILISVLPTHRQYFPSEISVKGNADADEEALGMEKFFFNARKNITTHQMDYPSMLAADIADRAMSNARKTHGVTTVPNFKWISMGPTNTGGHTSCILIDNNDPTHQTIFAGGITGGIWKSTNGGATWGNTTATISFSTEDTMANMNICCLAQDSKGVLYAGTGDGFTAGGGSEFSSGELGDGIFKSTDDGRTWRLLPSTRPTPIDNSNVAWAYVSRIAIRPDSFQVIYAATNLGLMVSHDSGTTWNSAINSANGNKLTGYSLDVKISNDGSIVVAFSGGYGWYCYPQSANSNVFTQIKTTGAGSIFGNAHLIEFTISPTDANRIYASDVQASGSFGSSSGIFMTMNAKTSGNGGYWYDIGSGSFFDPYKIGGFDQATYDNTLAVFPTNESQLLLGGIGVLEWSGANNSDTVGTWAQVSNSNSFSSQYVHSDQHAIAFDLNNPQTVYFGNDGGLFKCANMSINPSNPTASIASLVFNAINRNYNITQYYTLCFSPYVNYVNVSYNGSPMVEGLGMGGGSQDQGSPYINGADYTYPNDGTDLSGGDGGGCAVSQLDPNIAYFCSDYGDLLRENNLTALAIPTSAYTQFAGDCKGGDIDSVSELEGACFVFPVALYENPYDTLNHDSVSYIAPQADTAGETVWPYSANGGLTFPYVLPKAVAAGDTLLVPDRVVSRLAVGYAGTKGGIWINGQGAGTGTVVWMPIGGPDSKPTAFSDGSPVHALAWTPDGNTLFAGCEDGGVYRFTNINSIIANDYCSGALWYSTTTSRNNPTGNTNIPCIQLTVSGLTGRDVLSISTDPKDTNNLLITAGNYGQTDFVYYSNNATSAAPTFKAVQGNLPAMPVYSSILDILDSNGNSIPNSAMVGTEHGIYTTSNITAVSVVWTKNNGGMSNVMTLALKQQTTVPWIANNTGIIYTATHGRGLWSSNTEYKVIAAVPNITATAKALNDLLIYPNPMTSEGNIEFNLASVDNVTIAIYDMQGNEVKTMNMGNISPGSHLVTFASSGFPGGIYFASLTGNNFRKVSKFVVVK